MAASPAHVRQTIEKIVSLLSHALVLSLKLLTATVIAGDTPNLELEEQRAAMQIEHRVEFVPASENPTVVEHGRAPVTDGNRFVDL